MTKKWKRPLQLEESPVEYPGGTGIGLDFDDYDDEEIIDLEEEIQLSDISYDDDDPGESKIEVLDVDFGGFLDLAGSEPEDEKELFADEPLQEISEKAPGPVVHLEGPDDGDEPDVLEELSLLGGLRPPETKPAEEKSDAASAPVPNAAGKIVDPELKTEPTATPQVRESDVELKWEPALVDSPPPELLSIELAEPSVKTSPEIEDLVSQMEARIVELLRETIRSELPGLVRSVIRDEFERLNKGPQ